MTPAHLVSDLAIAWAAAQAAAPHLQSQAPAPVPPPPDIRQALQQYQRGAVPAPAPRQLTAPERAELRRQLSEYAQPPVLVRRR